MRVPIARRLRTVRVVNAHTRLPAATRTLPRSGERPALRGKLGGSHSERPARLEPRALFHGAGAAAGEQRGGEQGERSRTGPRHRPRTVTPGRVEGVFGTGEAAAITAGPAIMTTLVAGVGAPGWLALGALFIAAGAGTIPATRWALRTRVQSAAG